MGKGEWLLIRIQLLLGVMKCSKLDVMNSVQLCTMVLKPLIFTINAGEGVEKREPSYTVGGNVNWYSHYGEQYGGSLKN